MSERTKMTATASDRQPIANMPRQIPLHDRQAASLWPIDVLYLQTTIGNRTVQYLLRAGIVQARLTVEQEAYKTWVDLWSGGYRNAFADAVAWFQAAQWWPSESIDGILGPKTRSVIAGLGEAMAGIQAVNWAESDFKLTFNLQREHIHKNDRMHYSM